MFKGYVAMALLAFVEALAALIPVANSTQGDQNWQIVVAVAFFLVGGTMIATGCLHMACPDGD